MMDSPTTPVPRRRRGVRWSVLAVAVVAVVVGATVAAVEAVQRSGLGLLDQIASEEAAGTAVAVARAIDERVVATSDGLERIAADPGVAQRLAAGDPSVCQTLAAAASGAAGAVLDDDGNEVCGYGNADPEQRDAVRRWAIGMGGELTAGDQATVVRFSPVPLAGTVVTATRLGEHLVLHWMSGQDQLLRGFVERLGPRNLAMAFTPTGAARPDLVIDVAGGHGNVRDSAGYDVPDGRGVGPLGIDAYWAQARTESGNEAVSVAIDPDPYDWERDRLESGLLAIAGVLAGVALLGVGLTLWWTNRSIRRLGDAVDEASDGTVDPQLAVAGPRDTRRIAAALVRLADSQVQADVAADAARLEERSRIVTTLDVDVAAVLDEITAALSDGATLEEYRVELDLVIERLRDVVAMLHPTALHQLGLRSAVASQLSQRPGWVLTPGPEVAADPLVAGLLYSILADLWYRNSTGSISIGAAGDDLRVSVTGVQRPLSNRWAAPVMSMGGRIDADEDRIVIVVGAHIEEFVS